MNKELYDQVDSATILRAEVGSRVWGLNLDHECDCETLAFKGAIVHFDGCASKKSGDRDELGICVEGLDLAMGLSHPFEQFVYRSAEDRDGKDAPSQAGDLDLTIYSLRKFLRLALKGNPTILTLLFIPRMKWVKGDARGSNLQELSPKIVSRQAGKAYLGYLTAQKQRFLGERGGRHGKPQINDQNYDSKYAMHMLRLGYQGVELLLTGDLEVPMAEETRSYLLSVRKGEQSSQDILTRTGELERHLKDLIETSPLPEQPNKEAAEKWVLETYWQAWRSRYETTSGLRKLLGLEELAKCTGCDGVGWLTK